MPSILDGLPKSEAALKEIHAGSSAALGALLDAERMPPQIRARLEAMGEGLSHADILGITEAERDALLVQGVRQLQQGDVAGAQNTLTMLYQLEPGDARAVYALAATYQTQEAYRAAGRLYLVFLALDATNPQGYLRLGECFLGNGEADQAQAYLEAAKVQAAGTPEQGQVEAHADSLLSAIAARAAA